MGIQALGIAEEPGETLLHRNGVLWLKGGRGEGL